MMQKSIYMIVVFPLIFICNLAAQRVEGSFPQLAEHEARLYYFSGTKTDSVQSMIDTSGKLTFDIPLRDYRGMVSLVVTDAGGIEMILAEPTVSIESPANKLDNETVHFPQSRENQFLSYIFTNQRLYMEKQAWLEAGQQMFKDSTISTLLPNELSKVRSSMAGLNQEISNSNLYAAEYFRLAEFMNNLFNTEQTRDRDRHKLIRHQMEKSLDMAALYRSGQLWESVLNFYLSMFNQTVDDPVKQEEYAKSVLKTSRRLPAPYFEAFLAGCITETERFGWRDAQQIIIEGLLVQYKGFISSYPVLQRAIGAYKVSLNMQLPAVIGLADTDKSYDYTLIVFHDSDCNSCVNEMTHLRQLYPELQEKKVRVVSIAADTDEKRYYEAIQNFPWEDNICDFKGFAGTNFSNYNVMATPVLYLLNRESKLVGEFYSVSDLQQAL